jgi:hypothetical protein
MPLNLSAAVLVALTCLARPALPGTPGESRLLYGSVVFITSSPGSNMGALLASQIARYKVPVTVTSERPYANYILAAYAEPNTGTAPASTISAHAVNRGATWSAKAVLADASTHAIAWTAEFDGPCHPCDAAPDQVEQIMATRFIKQLKHDLFSRQSFSERIDDFLAP